MRRESRSLLGDEGLPSAQPAPHDVVEQIMEAASDRGFIHLVGRPLWLSQYGQPYVVYLNGAAHTEGAEIDAAPPSIEGTLDRWALLLGAAELEGRTAIVWRRQPEAEYDQQRMRHTIRMRLHFQLREALTPVISWGRDQILLSGSTP